MTAPFVLDSVTRLMADHRGRAGYCASHGGHYAGAYAAMQGIGAVILNDAGFGRERAGIVGVELLQRLGVPAATIAHTSARIGDGADGVARGVLSFVNAAGLEFGLRTGMACAEALTLLSVRTLRPSLPPDAMSEARFEISQRGPDDIRVIGMDSNGLVQPGDAGHIIVTGSHGGLLGNDPATAVKYDVRAAVYNDAGFGIDNAGISRLPALDARGIAGACVSCFSARIGDAHSTYEDGVISAVNVSAVRRGGLVGQSCRAFVTAMALNSGAS